MTLMTCGRPIAISFCEQTEATYRIRRDRGAGCRSVQVKAINKAGYTVHSIAVGGQKWDAPVSWTSTERCLACNLQWSMSGNNITADGGLGASYDITPQPSIHPSISIVSTRRPSSKRVLLRHVGVSDVRVCPQLARGRLTKQLEYYYYCFGFWFTATGMAPHNQAFALYTFQVPCRELGRLQVGS